MMSRCDKGYLNMLKLTQFDEEKIRGALTSVASGSLSNLIYFLLVNVGKTNPIFGAVVGLQILGSLISYSFDILFAKHKFNGNIVPYTYIPYRCKYLLKSFFSEMILRFVIAVIIMSITFYFSYKSWLDFAEKNKLQFKYDKYVYAILISVGLYFLFNHIILFDYVYRDIERSLEIDMIIIGIMIVTLILYCFSNINKSENKKD